MHAKNSHLTALILLLALAPLGGISLNTVLGQTPTEKKAPEKSAGTTEDARKADRVAIAATLESLSKAFADRDGQALAAHWTAEGEYENETGASVQGRELLAKKFSEFFAKTPEVKAEIRPDSVKFLGQDTAISTGSVSVKRGATLPATSARYNALLVREEGKWRLASLSESPAEGPSIADLGWLIGEWKSVLGEGAEIRSVYSWSTNKKFIYVDFTLKEKGLSLSGKQVIGVDPATGLLHSWTFEADGGVGETNWSRDGEHWVLEADGTMVDGRTLTETNVLRRINDDTITFQSTNRLLDDQEFPDLPPVKVVRVKASN